MYDRIMKKPFILTIHYTNGSDYTHRDVVGHVFTGTDTNKDQLRILHKASSVVIGGVRTSTMKQTDVSLVDVAGVTITTHNEFGKQVTHQSIKNRLKMYAPEAVEK
jgi:hypothetical protein